MERVSCFQMSLFRFTAMAKGQLSTGRYREGELFPVATFNARIGWSGKKDRQHSPITKMETC